VVDGDTVVLKMDGREVKARLIGVDTPETGDPRKPVERFGVEATRFLREPAEGKSSRPLPLTEAAKSYTPCSRCRPPSP
jgi:endonuclease YncB( thermonuclease family)